MRFLVLLITLAGVFTIACGMADEPSTIPSDRSTLESTRTTSDSIPDAISTDVTPASVSDASSVVPITPTDSVEALKILTAGNSQFAFDFYNSIREERKFKGANLIFSPYGISAVFAMAYAGSEGETASQMMEVFKYNIPQEYLHPAFKTLRTELEETDSEEFELLIANSLWGEGSFNQDYLDTIALNYGAAIMPLDLNAINEWVREKTRGKIDKLFESLPLDTVLIGANAVYFKGAWLYPFVEDDVGTFTLLNGDKVNVPFIYSGDGVLPYASGEGYEAVLIPYIQPGTKMVMIVPEEGRFQEVEASFNSANLAELLDSFNGTSANLSFPKFNYETDITGLLGVLNNMGFTNQENFSGIGSGIFLTDAVHKATITVDEKGTEATAVTGFAMALSGSLEPIQDLTVDRPFIYFIVSSQPLGDESDESIDTILFMGAYSTL